MIDDPVERAADRLAERIVRTPASGRATQPYMSARSAGVARAAPASVPRCCPARAPRSAR